jgi:hypothetical protein
LSGVKESIKLNPAPGRKFQEALAEIRRAIPIAIAGDVVDVAGGIDGGGPAGLPDSAQLTVGRGAEDAGLLEGLGVVSHDPTVIGAEIFVGGPGDVDLAVG